MGRNIEMRRFLFAAVPALVISAFGISSVGAWEGNGPLIIDHACTDLSRIPAAWIDSTRANMRLHYAHTSHGEQIPAGLDILQAGAPQFVYAYEDNNLPTVPDAFYIFNGQITGTYITPHHYWVNDAAMNETRAVLSANPSINTSMFVWCQEMELYQDYWVDESVSAYLDSMSVLEAEFPDVTFVYCTGNAQAPDYRGHNRWKNNERIRTFCIENDKVLYDFADLDAWWYDSETGEWDQATYEYQGDIVPVEHPQWAGSGAGHTSYASCEQKAKAMWWLTTMLSGWYADSTGEEPISLGGLKKKYPGR